MTTTTSVKSAVHDALVGTALEPQLSTLARNAFLKHAVTDSSGDQYLTEEAFVDAIAPSGEDYHKIKRTQYAILFNVADRHKKGKVSLQDWGAFTNLLEKADAEYEIAFRLFDHKGTGTIDFKQFVQTFQENKAPGSLPFDWSSEWAALYVGGRDKRHEMTYGQFSQMLRGLQGERIRQAFKHLDKDQDGYIEPEDFQRIIQETAQHKLSDHLLDNLHTLCNISPGTKVSYANVRAFQNLVREMDLVELVVRSATSKSRDGRVDKTEFLNEAARVTRFSLFSPMEADILFHFASIDEPSGRLSLADFAKVLDSSWQHALDRGSNAAEETMSGNVLRQVAESVHHFALGSVAGAFGAFMVYPIDLVKTRMQNQRSGRVGEMLYKNSLDCARKVIKQEGVKGLYSGVLPQMVGVAPEKAIKLTVNDLVRGKFSDPETGAIWLGHELLAGGAAGGCQVIFTNPLEIVKIRLQVQGEVSKSMPGAPKRSAMWIVKNLGLVGLYKGASACLLRDIPFSAIYFPAYNHLKRDYFGESQTKKLGIFQLLTAGAIAGMPAAYLTTPCDVIKTRLQVEARKGEQSYTTLRDAAQKIWQQEGFKAFFKGGPARIMRSSPQFGFTLAGYEVLQNVLPLPGGHDVATAGVAPIPAASSTPLPFLRSRNALKIILDLDQNFGRPRVPEGVKLPFVGKGPSN
ncbi:mitochondrial carrier [Trichodelitschia bisporula]|uniref:Mitochondrial aspartate-glutamate transporter AGC1 n=1 Tax=Trichodelitschia bisporula TaxID=703511 RepID=A0A6G1HUD1_9PEZI|nr:mitochondrial carrier [Trichodelitschia bisporula]